MRRAFRRWRRKLKERKMRKIAERHGVPEEMIDLWVAKCVNTPAPHPKHFRDFYGPTVQELKHDQKSDSYSVR